MYFDPGGPIHLPRSVKEERATRTCGNFSEAGIQSSQAPSAIDRKFNIVLPITITVVIRVCFNFKSLDDTYIQPCNLLFLSMEPHHPVLPVVCGQPDMYVAEARHRSLDNFYARLRPCVARDRVVHSKEV